MARSSSAIPLEQFATFGELLRFLRLRAGLTQVELSVAVGCSGAQISRLEQNQRAPYLPSFFARFVPALGLQAEPEIVARLRGLAQPSRSPGPAVVAHNLRASLTSFIGRQSEIAAVQDVLARARLVTLTGAGGCGKTRLALQVARDGQAQPARYPDGVWFVELAPLTDGALVAEQVAGALGLRAAAGLAWQAVLIEFLRARRLLLVLDNCEHLIAACAALAQALVQACDELCLLVTSREVLRVEGEQAWRVAPLSLPTEHDRLPLATIRESEAVQLFVERAATALPGFSLTDHNAAAVVQVCRRLDGMPLAIELAAARMGLLRVEQIVARLAERDRFALLTGGNRAALTRQQTLQATIDWSYELLSEAERSLLARLAVFVGGWSLEAAEAICAGEGLERPDVLAGLSQLVNKSLVQAQRAPGQAARYGLLETIRAYAFERLAACGAVERLRQQHARYFLALAEAANLDPYSTHSAGLDATDRQAFIAAQWQRLEPERDNFSAALQWASEHDTEAGFRLIGDLFWYWHKLGHFRQLVRWYERLAATDQAAPPIPERANALYAVALCARALGEHARARALYEQSVAIWRQLKAPLDLARTLSWQSKADLVQGDLAAARQHAEESITLSRAAGYQWGLGYALLFLASTWIAAGDDQTALALLAESQAVARQMGEAPLLAMVQVYLGFGACRERNYSQAMTFFAEGLTIWRVLPDPWSTAWCLEGIAWVAQARGHDRRAAQVLGAAEALREAVGNEADWFEHAHYPEIVAAAREQIGAAAFDAAWAEGQAMTAEQAIEMALEAE